MQYSQDIAGCLAEAAVRPPLPAAELDHAVKRAAASLPALKKKQKDNVLPLLNLPGRRDDIAAFKPAADEYRQLKNVIVLGTGGSSLGGQTLAALAAPGAGPVLHFMDNVDPRIFDHDPNIGGRYSVLSNVGLLPAMIAGLDVAGVREGAGGVLEAMLTSKDARQAPPALGAALGFALAERRRVNATVIMPYVDRLAHFGLWFRQLWAESLGKDGKGTTPIRAMGTVDQHSQLQLY